MNEYEIKSTLDTMENKMKEAFKDVFHFEVSGKYYEYAKGLYKYLPIKPINTLRQSLNIYRELLGLIINFNDLQARTIEVINKLLNDNQVRFEKSVVVIIHNDPRGNNKLRNWGRENGITVLAIYFNDIINKIDLRKLINVELYSNDPFDITGPVSSESDFFGRRDEAISFARKIQDGNIHSILGLRKTGKTSLLNRITYEANEKYDDIIIFIDCSRDEIWQLDANKLLKTIYINIKNNIEQNKKYSNLSLIKDYSPINIDTITELIQSTSKSIIFVFDEFDYITPSSPTNRSIWEKEFNVFWRQMRVIYQESCRRRRNLSLILCGVSSKWFRVSKIKDIENSALSLIPEEYIKPLHDNSVKAMVKSIGTRCGLNFDNSSLELINYETSGIPSWTRKACSFINRHVHIEDRPIEVNINFTKKILTDFCTGDGITYSAVAIEHLFTMYPEIKDIVKRLNLNSSEITLSEKQLLISYGIIKSDGNFSGSLMKNAIFSCLEQKEVIKTEVLSIKNESTNEWEEEIAEISKRQNKIEKTLRRIILEVLRADSRANQQNGTTKERLLTSFEKKRRTELGLFGADEILEKSFWLELIQILKREWKYFEFCFGDEANFLKYMNHLNDRPYAHAKSLDAIDVVAFKNSLKYIEEKILKYEND